MSAGLRSERRTSSPSGRCCTFQRLGYPRQQKIMSESPFCFRGDGWRSFVPAPTARGPQAAGGTAGRSPPSHRPSAPASSRYLPEDTETPQSHLDAGSASLRSPASPPSSSSSRSPSRSPAGPGPWKRSGREGRGGAAPAGARRDARGDDAMTARAPTERTPRAAPAPSGGPTNGSADEGGRARALRQWRPRTGDRRDGAGGAVGPRGGKRRSADPRHRRRPRGRRAVGGRRRGGTAAGPVRPPSEPSRPPSLRRRAARSGG